MAGNANSGRKGYSEERANAKQTITEAAPKAARYIADVIVGHTLDGKKVRVSSARLGNAWNVIYQALGKPRQMIGHDGGEDGGPMKIEYILRTKAEEPVDGGDTQDSND